MSMQFVSASSQRISVSSAAWNSTQNKQAITFSAWLVPSTIGSTNQLVLSVCNGVALNSSRISIVRLGTSGLWRVYARRLDADSGQGLNALASTGDNVLCHVLGRARFFDGHLDLWVNGVQVNTVAVPGWSGGSTSNTASLSYFIGCQSDETLFYNGIVDDLRVYSRSLTNDECERMYHTMGRDGIINGLEQKFLFREKAMGTAATGADSIADIGPTLATGTPINSPTYLAALVPGRPRRMACT
jgi:hypothetical protein